MSTFKTNCSYSIQSWLEKENKTTKLALKSKASFAKQNCSTITFVVVCNC